MAKRKGLLIASLICVSFLLTTSFVPNVRAQDTSGADEDQPGSASQQLFLPLIKVDTPALEIGPGFAVDPENATVQPTDGATEEATEVDSTASASTTPRLLTFVKEIAFASYQDRLLKAGQTANGVTCDVTSQFGCFIIWASFRNITPNKFIKQSEWFLQPFFFTKQAKNIQSSTEPQVSNADLGGDGILSPGETTAVFVFKVVHKKQPFIYVLNVNAVVSLTAPTNVPPVVTVTTPIEGATFTAPANITINANASDSDGAVSKVEFFQGNSKLGEVTSAPYSFVWNSVATGAYTLTVKATDDKGAMTASIPVHIIVNPAGNTPPSASITSPTEGAQFTAPVTITINATASDMDGTIAKVEFFAGANNLGEVTSAPYSFVWNNVASGVYTLTVTATDDKGALSTSSSLHINVNPRPNVSPAVSITSPTEGEQFTAPVTVTINATATDPDGTISKVEFFEGANKLGEANTSPYSFAWSNVATGSYTLTVKATDDKGATTTSASVHIGVNPPANQPPVVNLSNPSDGAQYTTPVTLTLTANASDPDGAINKTEFFENQQKLGEALASPYSFAWINVPTGAYSLTVSATDNLGATTVSSAVHVTVSPPAGVPPVVTLNANPTTGALPLPVNFNATITGAPGDVLSYTWDFGNGESANGSETVPASGMLLVTQAYTYTTEGAFTATLTARNSLGQTGSSQVAITAEKLTTVVRTTPTNGESNVSVTRETIIEFSDPINASTLIPATINAQTGGQSLANRLQLSPDRKRVTLFYAQPVPASATITLTINGDQLTDDRGKPVDADGNGQAGGVAMIAFTTLSLTRIPGTDVWGFVYDSYNKNPDGTDKPIVGATIRIDGFPEANAVTDPNGYFILKDMPAPEFFVHIDGSTATNAPPNTVYATVGKAFHSMAGQSTQLIMDGATFNIYLPPMDKGDIQPLSPTQNTNIGFGAAGKAELGKLFPTMDPAVWDRVKVTFPPNSAQDDAGHPATQAAIIPVPADRLPAPLPPGMDHRLDIAVQAIGATNFATPAPACFPNLPDPVTGQPAPAGAKRALMSFNHDAGRWEIVGPMTVSMDGLLVCTNPGVGIRAPGWHGVQGGVTVSGPPPKKPPPPPDWDEIHKILQANYNSKKGSAEAALAHQLLCISDIACQNESGWGGGFVKEVMRDTARNIQSNNPNDIVSAIHALCGNIPAWVLTSSLFSAGDICAGLGGFLHHFPSQLFPSFWRHCALLDPNNHNRLLSDAVVPCFDKVVGDGELTPWSGLLAQGVAPKVAVKLRELIMALCPTIRRFGIISAANRGLAAENNFPQLPPPLTKDELFSPRLTEITTLQVTADNRFFVPVGSSFQLKITKLNADSSIVDLSSSTTGTQYFAVVGDGTVNVTPNGFVSILGTPSPFTSLTPLFYIIVRNGNDFGVGQFAITDSDSDGDLIVDSYERKISLNPNVQNGLNSDIDGDGLSDLSEALLMTNPTNPDTDGDGIDDGTERRLDIDTIDSSRDLIPQTSQHYFVVENLDTGSVVRGSTTDTGYIDNLILAPNTRYQISIIQPSTLLIGKAKFTTTDNGTRLTLPLIILEASLDGDSDSDKLPDDGEFIMGTDPNNPDSDGDGIPDGVEVQQGSNPLDGKPARTGIIATVDTPGNAVDLCTLNDVAVVADADQGVALVNILNREKPMLITQVATLGSAQRVACTGVISQSLAVVANGNAGLAIIDFTNPAAARLVHQIGTTALGGKAQAVVASTGLAYVGLDSSALIVVDLTSGTVLERVTIGEPVVDVAIGGDVLYALSAAGLYALPLNQAVLQVAASVASPTMRTNQRLFIGNDIAYATHKWGFNTFSLADPAQPVLIAAGNPGQVNWEQLILNGSGLGVAAVGVGIDDARDLYLHNVSDPTQTNRFLTSFDMPGSAEAIAIDNGLAYVADGSAGLHVVNYLAYDVGGVPPTLSLTINASAGAAEEGQPLRATAIVSDDVQVRSVDFYVDEVKVATDGSFPFEYRFIAPRRSQQASFTVRVVAWDTGGNSTTSTDQVITLTADSTAPQLARVSPSNGAIVGNVGALAAFFSEPLNPASLTHTSFVLTEAGLDGQFNTADDRSIITGTLELRPDVLAALMTFPGGLPNGFYRAAVTGALMDLTGHALANPQTWSFHVVTVANDSDNDCLPDAVEIALGLNPNNSDSDGDSVLDGDEDFDNDSLTNCNEVIIGTDLAKMDTDSDGIPDGAEDADNDGLTNSQETVTYHTNPVNRDTDGDSFFDGTEVTLGSDPLDPNSTPSTTTMLPGEATGATISVLNLSAPPTPDLPGEAVGATFSVVNLRDPASPELPGEAAGATFSVDNQATP